jgi:hypothetical protein
MASARPVNRRLHRSRSYQPAQYDAFDRVVEKDLRPGGAESVDVLESDAAKAGDRLSGEAAALQAVSDRHSEKGESGRAEWFEPSARFGGGSLLSGSSVASTLSPNVKGA